MEKDVVVSVVHNRFQQTLARSTSVQGYGLFGGVDVTLELHPADPNTGIVFERTDGASPVRIPAVIENVISRPRCTVISAGGRSVAVIEHVMAALAGLHVDNCLLRISAPEPPVGDGSSQIFVDAILSAGIVTQDVPRDAYVISQTEIALEGEQQGVAAQPPRHNEYEIGFILDYPDPVIGRQTERFLITPENFARYIAFCRTFVLEAEVNALRQQGIGLRATPQDVLVFGPQGPLDNRLHVPTECVNHKILDCIGDFALIGCDLQGRFTATQSGHRHNHSLIRLLRQRYLATRQQDRYTLRAAS